MMQLKLELFEDSLDKYRRGRYLNQKLLQTGKPKGTYNRGDTHPLVVGILFSGFCEDRTNPEKWIETAKLKEITYKQRKRAEKIRRDLGVELKNFHPQTNSIKGTFKKGDKHPFQEGLCFYQYHKNGYECWTSLESFEKRKIQKLEWTRQNKELCKEQRRRYLATESGRLKKRICNKYSTSKRRAKIRKYSTNLTKEQEGVIKQIYAHAARLTEKLKIPFHVDHIIPIAKGGLHHPLNLQIAPAIWNLRKQDKNTERWLPNGM